MARPNKRKLQSLINKCVKAQNAYYIAQTALSEYVVEIYGCEPGDVDAEWIIDAVFGGEVMSSGATADEFHAEMTAAIELAGR